MARNVRRWNCAVCSSSSPSKQGESAFYNRGYKFAFGDACHCLKPRRRKLMRSMFALSLGLSCLIGVAYAANVHVKSGPSFTDNGLTLPAVGELAGRGFQDIVIGMTAVANPVATCTNPAGQTQPPGHNPAPVAVSATPQSIPASEIKNGNTPFSVTTNPPS